MRVYDLAKSVYDGVITIPADVYFGLERSFEDLNLTAGGILYQNRNRAEDDRFLKGLTQVAKKPNVLFDMIKFIVNDVLEKLPEPAVKKILEGVTLSGSTYISKTQAQAIVSYAIASRVIKGTSLSSFVSRFARINTIALISAVMVQGTIARAARSSRNLLNENPKLYYELKKRNWDMLYFLAESSLDKFLLLDRLYHKDRATFEKVIHEIESL
ncbi:Uncharacterised protein [Serratia entomophila]|uniref:Uncharacterized protein n=1 Tax=Serratia entomophila TaxID=42906 RepID=A0ABY5CV32_9GAMM|nr:hypothetical protein [Serratia entomophila]UIW19348.1 hypothetical protein KHA73_05185 [Serratia entomophila]USV01936.1 hypothetical protein KFQ06_05260 [Serratia entomophila]CAI0709399.1 Uncharacterised protein [Serratia entomophila]CAI0776837.1 Uncharacterised protein [Serratia entomophila]CAI0780764.1 Uncharacterised protein [Serratia entomophila]